MAYKSRINMTAILYLVAGYQLIGTLWFSNFLFGEVWVISVSKSVEDLGSYGILTYIVGVILAYFLNLFLANLCIKEKLFNFSNAFFYLFRMWVLFFVPLILPVFIYTGYPIRAMVIFLGYTLVCLGVSAFGITRWPARR